jgi:hypothetical protein
MFLFSTTERVGDPELMLEAGFRAPGADLARGTGL